MADEIKISELEELTTPADDDLLVIVDQSESGSGIDKTKKIQAGNLGGGRALSDLTDVEITSPSDDQALIYDDGSWVNKPTASGLTGLVDDTTPQLGGDLDLNTYSILNQSKFVCNGRLTLESGVPISTSNQADKETLYFTPYNGNEISLYNGTNWIRHTFTELTLALGALTASKPHDIFIYNNSGTLTLSATEWTNATTRATALTRQDGVYVKTGATNYRYLGTIYIDSGQKCQDTEIKRFVWNLYNQTEKSLYAYGTTLHTYSTAAYRSWNNDTSTKVEMVTGIQQSILAGVSGYLKTSVAAKFAIVGFYQDADDNMYAQRARNGSTEYIQVGGMQAVAIPAGYHYLIATQYQTTVADGTYSTCLMSGSIKQ